MLIESSVASSPFTALPLATTVATATAVVGPPLSHFISRFAFLVDARRGSKRSFPSQRSFSNIPEIGAIYGSHPSWSIDTPWQLVHQTTSNENQSLIRIVNTYFMSIFWFMTPIITRDSLFHQVTDAITSLKYLLISSHTLREMAPSWLNQEKISWKILVRSNKKSGFYS